MTLKCLAGAPASTELPLAKVESLGEVALGVPRRREVLTDLCWALGSSPRQGRSGELATGGRQLLHSNSLM